MEKNKVVRIVFLVVYAAVVVNYFLEGKLKTSVPVTWQLLLTPLVALSGMAIGVVFYKDRRSASWILLFIAQVLFTTGAVINFYYTESTGTIPYPGPADLVYLIEYPVLITGLLYPVVINMVRRPTLSSIIIPIFIVGLVFGFFSYPLLISPYEKSSPIPLPARVLSTFYPALDMLVLFSVLIILAIGWSVRRVLSAQSPITSQYIWLLVGSVGFVVSDTVFSYAALHWMWGQPSTADIGWIVMFGAWALAFLSPPCRVETVGDKQ